MQGASSLARSLMSARLIRPVFFDTNILVYQFDRSDPHKRSKAIEIVTSHFSDGKAVISSQVVQEFINVALGKFKTKMSQAELQDVLDGMLKPLCAHFPTLDFYERSLR